MGSAFGGLPRAPKENDAEAWGKLSIREQRDYLLEDCGTSADLISSCLKEARLKPGRDWYDKHHISFGFVKNAGNSAVAREYFDRPRAFDTESFADEFLRLRDYGDAFAFPDKPGADGFRKTVFTNLRPQSAGFTRLSGEPGERDTQWGREQKLSFTYSDVRSKRSRGTNATSPAPEKDRPQWNDRFGAGVARFNRQLCQGMREYFDTRSPRWARARNQRWRGTRQNTDAYVGIKKNSDQCFEKLRKQTYRKPTLVKESGETTAGIPYEAVVCVSNATFQLPTKAELFPEAEEEK